MAFSAGSSHDELSASPARSRRMQSLRRGAPGGCDLGAILLARRESTAQRSCRGVSRTTLDPRLPVSRRLSELDDVRCRSHPPTGRRNRIEVSTRSANVRSFDMPGTNGKAATSYGAALDLATPKGWTYLASRLRDASFTSAKRLDWSLRATTNPQSPLRGLRAFASYAAIEVLLPGGSLIALATWLYRRRRAVRHVHDQSAGC